MTERDFGQVETTTFESHDMSSSSMPIIITVLATTFAIICFAVGFYMGEEHGVSLNKGKKHEELITKLQNQKDELESLKEDAQKWKQMEANTSQVGELTFYNELPEQSIIPEPLDAKPIQKNNSAFLDKLQAELKRNRHKKNAQQTTDKTIEGIIKTKMQNSSRTFRVQIASFREEKDALALLPKLQGLNIPSEVERAHLSVGIYYRVYTKTFTKEQDAMQAKQLIKQKLHMDGLLIQNDS